MIDKFKILYVGVLRELSQKVNKNMTERYIDLAEPYHDLIDHYWEEQNWEKFQKSIILWREFWLTLVEKEGK